MKSIALIFSLLLAFVGIAPAQDIITPTNRIELFNGTNFDGITFCMRNDADPMQTWSVTNGVIHCNGSAVGYLRTKQNFQNYILTVEWRFVKVEPKKDNTGVLVHMQAPPDKVWPPCIQNQGKSGRQGDLIYMSGAESKEHKGMDANTPVPLRGEPNEKAIGEWNTNVTVCSGNNVKAIINGKLLNEGTECSLTSGAIGIQSEGADFEIRKMYLEPLNQPTEFFKVITDPRFGQYAVVNADKTVVTLKDKNNNDIWSANVVTELEPTGPVSGAKGEISSMEMINGQLIVRVRKGLTSVDTRTGKIGISVQEEFAKIDRQTGKITSLGCCPDFN